MLSETAFSNVNEEPAFSAQDSGIVRNRRKIRSYLFVAILYLILMLIPGAIILVVVCPIITMILCRREEEAARRDQHAFRKSFPFRYYGELFGDFQHIFFHEEVILPQLLAAIERDILIRTNAQRFDRIILTDSDRDLAATEDRSFLKAAAGRTQRGTSVTLIMRLSECGRMQSVRWWILVGGFIDSDKKFNFIMQSPATIWFWIRPYIKREFDILSKIRTVYSSAYNDMDIITEVRCMHEVIFNAMVDELENNGVDTSEIKVQRMQVMNISISGGRVSMGNVVQGAMNRVVGQVKAATA